MVLRCTSNSSQTPTFKSALSSLFCHGEYARDDASDFHDRYPSCRLQEETARVEDELAKPKSLDALLKCFVSAKAGSFENILDPFLKICRHSTPIAIGVAKAQFFRRVTEKLGNSKAVVKLNLLRILRSVCDVHPNRALLVERYGIHETVAALRRKDGAVLVRELAREIEPSLAPALKPSLRGADTPKSSIAPKRRTGTTRRTASDTSGIGTPSPPLGTGFLNNPRVTSVGGAGVVAAGTTRGLSPRLHVGDIPWQSGIGTGRR
jgi:hypothetical protein